MKTGSIFGASPPKSDVKNPIGRWIKVEIRMLGRNLTAKVDGEIVQDVDLDALKDRFARFPGLAKTSGHIAFQQLGTDVEFRNILLRPLGQGRE